MSNELVKGITFDTVKKEGMEYEVATPFGVLNALIPNIDFSKYQESILMQQAIDAAFAQRVEFLMKNKFDESDHFAEVFNKIKEKYADINECEFDTYYHDREELYAYPCYGIFNIITNAMPGIFVRENYINLSDDEIQVLATTVAAMFYQNCIFTIKLKSKTRQESETLRILELLYELSHDVYADMVQLLYQIKEEAITNVQLPASNKDKYGRICNKEK